MKVLVDCSLSDKWVPVLKAAGHEAVHWKTLGPVEYEIILDWAAHSGMVVLTHDRDFATLLAKQGLIRPSVVQINAHSHLPSHIGAIVIGALKVHAADLATGAVLSIDHVRSKVRVLPLRQ